MMETQLTAVKITVCTLSLLLYTQWFTVYGYGVPSEETARKLGWYGVKETTIPTSQLHNTEDDPHFSPSSKVVGMAVPALLVLGCIFVCPCFKPKRKDDSSVLFQKEQNPSMDSASSFEASYNLEKALPSSRDLNWVGVGSLHLSFSEIAKATQNFSASYKINEGSFGSVYKAQLQSGQWIAVKRTKKDHFDFAEFNSEIGILSKIEHRHLVKLIGYVDRGNERFIITEYVSNGTLRDHLEGQMGKILDFSQRLEIAIEVAHALTYLHLYAEKQIIHRDVKSSNVLLTENLRAKVGDFGLARVGPVESGHTHISTKVKGTVGYLDPHYMKTYQLTPMSDVYSFGILLLEIITGRRPVDAKLPVQERVLIKWAIKKYNEGEVQRLVDPLMKEVVSINILKKMFFLSFQCAAPGRAERPDMKTVGEQLWAIRMEYNTSKTQ